MADQWTTFQDLLSQEPTKFTNFTIREALNKNLFVQSGVMGEDKNIEIPEKGRKVHIPEWNDLDGDEDILTENKDIEIGKVSVADDEAAIITRVKSFGRTDLSAEFMGDDPMGLISARFAAWWTRQDQKRLITFLNGAMGAFNDNTLDISTLTTGAENIDGYSVVDAESLLGDRGSDLKMMAIHSHTYYAMKKQDMIEIEKDSQGKDIATYQGKRLLVDDGMPHDSGVYTTYLFGGGAIAYREGSIRHSTEVARDSRTQGGRDFVIQRRKMIMHPRGIKWIGTPVNETATNEELGSKANWNLVHDPKRIRIVKLLHKVG